MTYAGCLKEIEITRILTLIKGGILCSFGVANHSITLGGRNEVIVNLCTGAHCIHIVLVELVSCGMTETIEHVCTESTGIVGILLIGDLLNKYRGVEVDERTIYTSCSIGIEIDGSERSVGTIALAHRSHTTPSA